MPNPIQHFPIRTSGHNQKGLPLQLSLHLSWMSRLLVCLLQVLSYAHQLFLLGQYSSIASRIQESLLQSNYVHHLLQRGEEFYVRQGSLDRLPKVVLCMMGLRTTEQKQHHRLNLHQ